MLQQIAGTGERALTNLAQIGQASAAGVGAGALQSGQQVSNLLQGIGSAQAGAQLAQGRARSEALGAGAGLLGDITKIAALGGF